MSPPNHPIVDSQTDFK